MPKYVFHKLVRDGLEQLYIDLEQKAAVRHLQGDTLWRAMKAKFVEEALELPDDPQDTAAVTSELADLLRILKDAAAEAGVAFTDVEKADEAKTSKKGGFRNGVFVDTLELKPDDPWNEYYRKEPLRFPELQATPDISRIIHLSDELAELGKIDRRSLLPGGRQESDSHHSFSLALIAHDICQHHCPELDANRVIRYALIHDLLEIITGDEDTLLSSASDLHAKHQREQAAWAKLEERFKEYPELLSDLKAYEALDSAEAAAVYVLDKSCTIWTHFWDDGKSLHSRGMKTRKDIDTWYATQREKLQKRLKVMPPQIILDIFAESQNKMRQELFER